MSIGWGSKVFIGFIDVWWALFDYLVWWLWATVIVGIYRMVYGLALLIDFLSCKNCPSCSRRHTLALFICVCELQRLFQLLDKVINVCCPVCDWLLYLCVDEWLHWYMTFWSIRVLYELFQLLANAHIPCRPGEVRLVLLIGCVHMYIFYVTVQCISHWWLVCLVDGFYLFEWLITWFYINWLIDWWSSRLDYSVK